MQIFSHMKGDLGQQFAYHTNFSILKKSTGAFKCLYDPSAASKVAHLMFWKFLRRQSSVSWSVSVLIPIHLHPPSTNHKRRIRRGGQSAPGFDALTVKEELEVPGSPGGNQGQNQQRLTLNNN